MGHYFRYLGQKTIWYLITLVIAVALNFFLPRMIEGNPVSVILGNLTTGMSDTNSQKKIFETFNKEFGLDKPLIEQFGLYLGGLFQGDMGTSFTQYPRKVNDILATAVPWTLAIQLPATIIGWFLGNILGAYAAYKKGVFDKVLFPLSMFINSIPPFAFSIILLYLFAIQWKVFPTGNAYSFQMIPAMSWAFISSVLYHWTLPFLSVLLVWIGGQAIGMRSMAIYELNADYVLYSKLMGVKERKIVRYVFRNAVLPQVTGLAVSLGTMVGGALVTEIVFSYPGIGTYMFKGISGLDYPLISGCTLLITIGVLIANFVLEVIYGLIDPRIKASQLGEG